MRPFHSEVGEARQAGVAENGIAFVTSAFFGEGLRDEDAIERVVVVARKRFEPQGMADRKGSSVNPSAVIADNNSSRSTSILPTLA